MYLLCVRGSHDGSFIRSGYSMKRSDVTRWKQGYITPPPPYFILWNAVTSLGENKVIKHPLPHSSFCDTQWRHSVKTRLYKIPFPILHCISQLDENKGGQGHWVWQNSSKLATERSPHSGQCPTLIEWLQGFFILHITIDSTTHSRHLNSLEHCTCTTSMTDIRPGRDSSPLTHSFIHSLTHSQPDWDVTAMHIVYKGKKHGEWLPRHRKTNR